MKSLSLSSCFDLQFNFKTLHGFTDCDVRGYLSPRAHEQARVHQDDRLRSYTTVFGAFAHTPDKNTSRAEIQINQPSPLSSLHIQHLKLVPAISLNIVLGKEEGTTTYF